MTPWLISPLRGEALFIRSLTTWGLHSSVHRRWYTSGEKLTAYHALRTELGPILKTPEYFNLAKDVVGKWAKKKPDSIALHFTNGANQSFATYQKLFQEATALATALSNPTPPKCALVLLPKVFEWWVVNVAGSWCGTVISPATTLLTANDVSHRLSECGADCIICDSETAIRMDAVTKDIPLRIVLSTKPGLERSDWVSYEHLLQSVKDKRIRPCAKTKGEDICQLLFTSGTSGKPKMVPHTQASYGIGHIATCKYWLDISENDVMWNISDTGWAKSAWSNLYTPILSGATAFVHQMPRFNAHEALRSLCEYPVSILCAPPTAYRAMVQCELGHYKFHSLRHCVSGGEPLNPEVMQKWFQHTGLRIYEGYGQSETTLLCAVGKGVEIRPGSMGMPAPGYNLKVVDENFEEVGPNIEGYIAVSLKEGHPVGLFKGYVASEKRTSEVFVGNYYVSGDKGYYDKDGYFWFVGRSDDVINSSGYRIGPFEIESALLEHPAVIESAVVSSPDKLRGEVVKAFVVLTDEYKNKNQDLLIKELQDHVKLTTAPYKYPRKIDFVDGLPKNISGKIKRFVLRKQEWENS
ncbi:Acyl-coenzyme A synthetase acsm3, mitochondrial [Halocaridina rubra]|uniref:medium-chain acyl-CoA ligase n=1 Tax=Halocaridina rubra TaxID=373956 RepID=A0AAN8XNR7_HALRR